MLSSMSSSIISEPDDMMSISYESFTHCQALLQLAEPLNMTRTSFMMMK